MIHIPIHEELFEPIRQIAEQEKTSVENLVNSWLTRQLALAREKKIKEESTRFQAMHSELLAEYRGKYIAMHNGEVLDHDADIRELYLRIKKQYGEAPVLIALVTEEPVPTYQMRSPRFVK
ncbi:MAG: hypothetical protein JXA78_01020 [Anaerolineales bacterium]|nr:hypothetical protein [Anaerolineales bacterium]